jgi:2-methylfumaryl-CoA isomerase
MSQNAAGGGTAGADRAAGPPADGEASGEQGQQSQAGGAMSGTAGGPLAGMRVIELSSYVASPLCGMTLAQLGADVIRVDPIGGVGDRRRWPLAPSGASLPWAGLNKGKRSVTVNLRSDAGRKLVADLIVAGGREGGIVVTNSAAAGPLAWPALRQRRPDVICVQLLGRPDGGTAVDYTVNAAAGFPLVTGPASMREPVNHVLPAWDVACGLYLATGLLAAERQRLLTGQGQQIVLALSDVALATAGNLGLLTEAQLGGMRPRIGNDLYGGLARDFAVAGGRRVMVVVLTSRQWRDLAAAAGMRRVAEMLEQELGADFSRDADRYEHRDVLCGLLAPWFARRTVDEVASAFAGTSVLWSQYLDFAEAVQDASGGDLLAPLDQPGVGEHLAPGSPLRLDGQRPPPRPAPGLGQHGGEVLAGLLGLTATEVSKLRADGIIGPE